MNRSAYFMVLETVVISWPVCIFWCTWLCACFSILCESETFRMLIFAFYGSYSKTLCKSDLSAYCDIHSHFLELMFFCAYFDIHHNEILCQITWICILVFFHQMHTLVISVNTLAFCIFFTVRSQFFLHALVFFKI